MDPEVALDHWNRLSKKSTKDFLKSIHNDIIVSPFVHDLPFGKRKATYSDWFASGKPLKTVERIIAKSVLPFYANAHTNATSTARTTSAAVHNSRDTISRCLNAQTAKGHIHETSIIFCGNSAVSGILKVHDAFRLGDEAFWVRRAIAKGARSVLYPQRTNRMHPIINSLNQLPARYRPVVFVSIQDHRSNLIPWLESIADVVAIRENSDYQLDVKQLEEQLVLHWERPLKIGSITAGNDLTGALNDTVAIAETLHKYDAFAFFDYSSVGAYSVVDMNPPPSSSYTAMRNSLAYKDGVFLSPHRMLGGSGSSGVLAVRLEIFTWADRQSSAERSKHIPMNPGRLAIERAHKRPGDILTREEAGNPNLMANIRAGLAFRLHQIMNPRLVLGMEYELSSEIFYRLSATKNNITILGTPGIDRIPVFCATVSVPLLSTVVKPLQIHYELLSTIMNDFFGVEMESICAGSNTSQSQKFNTANEIALWDLISSNNLDGKGRSLSSAAYNSNYRPDKYNTMYKQCSVSSPSLKSGFIRFSFPHFAREKDVEFVIQSLEWVARYGFLLIPLYRIDTERGTWAIRPAVRRAVFQSINLNQLNSGHRGDYIQVATDCIYTLRELFLKQRKENKNRLLPTPKTLDVPSARVLHSLKQARLSFNNVFFGKAHLPPTFTMPGFTPYIPLSTSRIEKTRSMPPRRLTYFSSDYLSPHAKRTLTEGGADQYRSKSGQALSAEEQYNSNLCIPEKGPWHHNTPDTTVKDALEELSWSELELELRAVEAETHSRQSRWFVMPIEVADLYFSGEESLMCFPEPKVISRRLSHRP
ncbi:hypothetical protein BGX26_009339 [Mortierella sp. AD094]|nr:hypothetical protein BGX26_009339 [Mortierella sp. AD094]